MPRKKIIQSKENFDENEKQNSLKVEIVSNWSLLEILSDWKKVTKIIVALFVIVITIFIGLAFVTISIKRIYPYNDIKINAFGATTMQNEDNDVIYWLFNTADLWANSGIKVEAGDILTIRASGKSHTAIHHLVEDVETNIILRDKWVGTDGEEKTDSRDILRGNFRIFPNMAQDALLMQVVPEGIERNSKEFINNYLVPDNNNNDENFYFIGKERVDLRINNSGILYFAVNDIVLTIENIKKMINDNDSLIRCDLKLSSKDSIPEKGWIKWNKEHFKFGPHPDDSTKTAREKFNEMTYYDSVKYYNAWYDDNVGSFLIVVERKKNTK